MRCGGPRCDVEGRGEVWRAREAQYNSLFIQTRYRFFSPPTCCGVRSDRKPEHFWSSVYVIRCAGFPTRQPEVQPQSQSGAADQEDLSFRISLIFLVIL